MPGYGVGVDQVIGPRLYAGAEFSQRTLDVPALLLFDVEPQVATADWREQLARAYVYWTPWAWLGLGAEYLYERFDRNPDFFNAFLNTELKTHRVPLAIAFFHPSGITARLKTTYVNQELTVKDDPTLSGRDSFWVTDTSIGYRLPNRWGLVTLEARNLFDQRFRFQDTDPGNPTLYPQRLILVRFTLAY
jgi:outer membrane receptor protein involved in Fe transport